MTAARRKQPAESCRTCAGRTELEQPGTAVGKPDRILALAGNPNTGKSTLFNSLTGLRQHTGNWPGKTVTRAEGAFQFEGHTYKLVDLPGTYSLLSASQDEEVARDFILFGAPDCTIVVADATALERNLNLVLQVMEITDRVVVAVNLLDEASRRGMAVDVQGLARDLGVPAVPVIARTGAGIRTLLLTAAGLIEGRIATRPVRLRGTAEFRRAVGELTPMLEQLMPGVPNARWLAIRLLDGDAKVQNAILRGELTGLARRQHAGVSRYSRRIALEGRQ